MNKLFFTCAAATGLLIACTNTTEESIETPNVSDPITQHIDSSIAPGENFFLFANNGWFKKNPIPSSERSNGIFNIIQDTINESVKKICETSAAAKAEKGSNKQKIGDLYYSGMDTASIEKAGFSLLEGEFAKIDAIKNMDEMMAVVVEHNKLNVRPLFGFFVIRDDKNSSQYVASLQQVRLGLPERDYYLNNDSRNINIRKEYVAHIQKMFELTGVESGQAKRNSDVVMFIETWCAKSSRKMEDLRDPYKNYNKMSVASLNKLTPSIKWGQTFDQLGLKSLDSVVVGQPEYFTQLEILTKKAQLNDFKVYLKWTFLNDFAGNLSKKFEDQNFKFYAGVLEGIKEQKPRWKRIVEETNGSLGELIGQVYVAEYLPKGTKEKLLEIGNNIRDVFAEHIKKLKWMSDETKKKALSKLNKIVMKVGYPDKWKDMSSLQITRDNYLQNIFNIERWEYDFMINKYGKPVDLTEWDMFPQTYNAYYNPPSNEIVVPACNIIVPGFEGRMPDDAVLYGIIGGSTFGHEITHGFDDQGSLYDENGNLADWWTIVDRSQFVARTKLIVEQFNNYVVLDSMHVRGENTQGENIADLGGVIMGYEAFKKTKQGQSKELFNGYTADQRYFLAYAYAWMVNRTDASLAKQIMSDVHSPAEFRINGPLSDIDEFYTAFKIKKGDKMYRDEKVRVKIW